MKRHILAGAAILAMIMITCPGTYRGALAADTAAPRGGGIPPWGAPVPKQSSGPSERGLYRGAPPDETGQEARDRIRRQAERDQANESARPDDMPKKGDTAEHQREREKLR